MRRAGRIDKTQSEIVEMARSLGASVEILSGVGAGCPDLLVGYRGRNLLVEVKNGTKPPSAQRLTPHQVDWHDRWSGQVVVVNSASAIRNVLVEIASRPPSPSWTGPPSRQVSNSDGVTSTSPPERTARGHFYRGKPCKTKS